MPILSITSNQALQTSSNQLNTLSQIVAEALGKPEAYVMITLQHNPDMLFAGTTEPLAYCELKSIGLQESQTTELSRKLCKAIHELFYISPSRTYIEFTAPSRSMWGWDSKTF
jgi:phenylpyruvate tautomerase